MRQNLHRYLYINQVKLFSFRMVQFTDPANKSLPFLPFSFLFNYFLWFFFLSFCISFVSKFLCPLSAYYAPISCCHTWLQYSKHAELQWKKKRVKETETEAMKEGDKNQWQCRFQSINQENAYYRTKMFFFFRSFVRSFVHVHIEENFICFFFKSTA